MDIGGDTIEGAVMDSPGSPLGSWRALIAFRSSRPLISLSTFRPLYSLGSSWSVFAWGTRPASFSSNPPRVMRLAEQSIQGQLNFPIEVLMSNGNADVRFLISIF